MKYRIALHFTATVSKIVDIENEDSILDERERFISEYTMNEVAESLAHVDWDYSEEA